MFSPQEERSSFPPMPMLSSVLPAMPCRRRHAQPRRTGGRVSNVRTACAPTANVPTTPPVNMKYMAAGPDPRNLPDGCAVQEEGDPSIHVMCGGASFWVSDTTDFRLLGVAELGVVRQLPSGGLQAMRRVPADGSVFRVRGSEQVSIMVGGARLDVAHASELSLINVESRRLVVLPADAASGMPAVPSDGTLVRTRANGAWQLHHVRHGRLHTVTSPDPQALRAAQAAPRSIFDVLGVANAVTD